MATPNAMHPPCGFGKPVGEAVTAPPKNRLNRPPPLPPTIAFATPSPMSPPPQPLNLAIFGLGRWGNHLLRNFLALPTARVVAIVDPDRQRLEELRDRFALG